MTDTKRSWMSKAETTPKLNMVSANGSPSASISSLNERDAVGDRLGIEVEFERCGIGSRLRRHDHELFVSELPFNFLKSV